MTVLHELNLRGDLGGPETLKLVRRIFKQAAREFWVLAPTGWSADLLDDTLYEFLSYKLPDLTDAVVSVAATEAVVAKAMRRIMKNWLIDQARKTDLGAIRMRLEKLLRQDARFHRPEPTEHVWALLGVAVRSTADIESLVEAARAVSGIRPVRWSSEERRAPMASSEDLRRVLHSVLVAAEGGVEVQVFVTVFRRRFQVVLPQEVPFEDGDDFPDRAGLSPGVDGSLDLAGAVSAADEVFSQLSDRERRILHLVGDVPAIAAELGLGRSQAYLVNGKVKATVAALAGRDLDHVALVEELIRLARRAQ